MVKLGHEVKIMVVGSCRDLDVDQQRQFKAACVDLGSALARQGHTVLLCSPSERSADRHVATGISAVAGTRKILLYRPDAITAASDPETDPSIEVYRTMTNVSLEVAEVDGGWRVVHLRAIKDASLVIAISGSAWGTGTVIYSAEALEKAVVLINSFPGATRNSWRDFRRYYSNHEQEVFQREWRPASHWADDIVDVAVSFAKRKPMVVNRARTALYSFLCGASALAGWITILLLINGLPSPVAWIGFMVVLATFLGILLRTSIDLTKYSLYDRINDALQAIIIAFAVILLSELTTWFLENKPLVFGHVEDAVLLGWRLSLVGFLAGFVRDEYMDTLVKRAREIVRIK